VPVRWGKKPKHNTTYNDFSVIDIVLMKRLSNRYAGKSETTATVNTTEKKGKGMSLFISFFTKPNKSTKQQLQLTLKYHQR
tara:strand:+ start:391 stop:633 length:243 start_codon:yes stop_codon:yes gene_type:complete